ncbi:response regulator [Candidatus Riflebacteria bacterium]
MKNPLLDSLHLFFMENLKGFSLLFSSEGFLIFFSGGSWELDLGPMDDWLGASFDKLSFCQFQGIQTQEHWSKIYNELSEGGVLNLTGKISLKNGQKNTIPLWFTGIRQIGEPLEYILVREFTGEREEQQKPQEAVYKDSTFPDQSELNALLTPLYNLKLMAKRDGLRIFEKEISRMETILYKNKSGDVAEPSPLIEAVEEVIEKKDQIPCLDNSVMIINSEIIVRKIYQQAIAEHVQLCRTAGSGKIALQLFEKTQFKVVLVAENLPDMSGVELARGIKELFPEEKYELPNLIFCMDSRNEAEIKKVEEAGAFGMIFKPINLENLLPLVFKALEKEEFEF